MKKVKLGDLVSLYATLLKLDVWYDIIVEVDDEYVGFAVV